MQLCFATSLTKPILRYNINLSLLLFTIIDNSVVTNSHYMTRCNSLIFIIMINERIIKIREL